MMFYLAHAGEARIVGDDAHEDFLALIGAVLVISSQSCVNEFISQLKSTALKMHCTTSGKRANENRQKCTKFVIRE